MSKSERDQDLEKDMQLCRMAREALGRNGRPLSRARFSELTGVHQTMLYRRETGEVRLTSTARTLYGLIVGLQAEGLVHEVRLALEKVPVEDRGETEAALALSLVCSANGREWIVRQMTGDTTAEPELHDDHNVIGTLRLVEQLQKSVMSYSKKINPEAKRFFEDAAADLARVQHLIDRGAQLVREEEQAREAAEQPPDEGSST